MGTEIADAMIEDERLGWNETVYGHHIEVGGEAVDFFACDNAEAGILGDLPKGIVDYRTGRMVGPRPQCSLQRFMGLQASDSPFVERCAEEGAPVAWFREPCPTCAAHICIEHGIEYYINQNDTFGEAPTPGGALVNRTGLLVHKHKSGPLRHIDTPIYARGEPPVADRHRPLWAAWGEYHAIGPQRWLHNLEHGAVGLLYDPCIGEEAIARLRAFAESLHTSENGELADKVRTGMLVKGHARVIIAPHIGLARGFAVVMWQYGFMSSCVGSDADFASVRRQLEAFILEHHGKSPEADVEYPGMYEAGAAQLVPLSAGSSASLLDMRVGTTLICVLSVLLVIGMVVVRMERRPNAYISYITVMNEDRGTIKVPNALGRGGV